MNSIIRLIRRSCLSLGLVPMILTSPATRADSVLPLWSIAPDDRPYVTTANQERGVAYNPATGNVLLPTRAGGPKVIVLRGSDGADGSEETGEPRVLSQLDANGESPIVGGTFTLNLVGAADDGAVFACNLATTLGTVRIYRWADDGVDTPVSVAYEGNPLADFADPGTGQDIRFGDNFAVRGAGKDTQLLQTARSGRYVILYTTTDGVAFTAKAMASPALQGKAGLGLAFDQGNTFWAKVAGGALQRVEFDPANSRITVLNEVATGIVAGGVTGLGVDPVKRRLAGVDYVAHTLTLFDISDPRGLVRLGDPLPFPAANQNGNGTAAAAVNGDFVVGVDSNNGVLSARIEASTVVDPPVIGTPPASGTVYAGGTFSTAVTVQGTPPFAYQWFFDDSIPLTGATNSQLVLTDVTPAQAGTYSVAVSNASGVSVASPKATLTVREPLNTGVLQLAWALRPGDRPYFTVDNAQRGIAFNPANGNVLLATRSPSNAIVVLDGTTGTEKHTLRTVASDELPLFSGGTLPLNMIGVSDDGVVYAGNLVTDGSAAPFRLYRWDDDNPDTVPTLLPDVAELAIAERWGDTLDVRGRGAGTQILLGTRGLAPQEGRKFAVLSTGDGFAFVGQVFTVAEVAGSAFGLGAAFGPGNSVFGTSGGQPLVHASFDPADGTARLLRTYPAAEVPTALAFIGTLASSNLLAGVALETPDNVLLYDLSDPDRPVALDQQLILPEEANANGTGSVKLGRDWVYVLDTNHGLRAYRRGGPPSAPTVTITATGGSVTLTFTGILQTASQVTGPWTDVVGASSPWVVSPAGPGGFYRARR